MRNSWDFCGRDGWSLGCYRHTKNKNGRRTDLEGYQRRLKLFNYVHRAPRGENMGGNIPTYLLVKYKGIISRQNYSQEERASNWVSNPFSPSQNYFGNRFIRVVQQKRRYSRHSATTSTFTMGGYWVVLFVKYINN